MIFAISADMVTGIGFSLFIILPILAWFFGGHRYIDGKMISPAQELMNLRQPFHERHSKGIASGEILYIQGKLSRSQQLIARIIQIMVIILLIMLIHKQPEHIRSTIYLVITILAFIMVVYRGRRGLKYVKRKDSQ